MMQPLNLRRLTFTVIVFTSFATCAAQETSDAKPNVLFILIDDFGWRDVGYNGGTFYETPEMDRLSREWMRFNNCYTPSPMCSPTRVSILTGKNPARHGVTQWLPGRDKAFVRENESPRVHCPRPMSSGIQDREVTLGEVFQQANYETAFFGKWHMGKLNATGGPQRHGYTNGKAIIEENACAMFYPFNNRGKIYFPDAKEGDNFTDLLTDEAIDFVKADRDVPFYLHLCHFAMHAPIASKPEERKRYGEKQKQLPKLANDRELDDYGHQPQKLRQDDSEYAGELATLDQNIGRLVDALKESGQYNNTIIVFTGDNGGRSSFFKEHPTSNRPLRTGKTFVFEGGLKTPLLIHWPGHTSAGLSSDVPVCSTDFYPTLLEMAGLPLQPKQHVDGVSLVPLVNGDAIEREALCFHFPHFQGEGAYPASAIRKGDFKLIRNYQHDSLLLFNIAVDPGETKDLSATLPEKAKELDDALAAYLSDAGAQIPQPVNGTN
ncbi:MAG: sulfatase [Rubripirellula sp.]